MLQMNFEDIMLSEISETQKDLNIILKILNAAVVLLHIYYNYGLCFPLLQSSSAPDKLKTFLSY